MKVLVLGATGERPFRRGPGSHESPRLMHDREAVPPMQRVDFSRVQEPTYCRTI